MKIKITSNFIFKKYSKFGFTLVEVMIAAGIMVLCLSGLLVTYVGCFLLNETTRNTALAMTAARSEMEQLKLETFDNLNNHNDETFAVAGIARAIGKVEVTNVGTYTDLKQVRAVVCWQQSRGRVIGEDTNLNGALDAGEDTNSNNRLDSSVEAISLISK